MVNGPSVQGIGYITGEMPKRTATNRVLTPAQCRAARALLSWTMDDLAVRAKVSRRTLVDFEAEERIPREETRKRVTAALVAGGIRLLQTRRGEGVFLKIANTLPARSTS
jgi:transcriptional regulator with XRE-family HTH domain